jgi:hypothetical protein
VQKRGEWGSGLLVFASSASDREVSLVYSNRHFIKQSNGLLHFFLFSLFLYAATQSAVARLPKSYSHVKIKVT